MTTRYVTPEQAAAAHPSCGDPGCGCRRGGGCDRKPHCTCGGGGGACGCLPCLSRPHFYCGMVLTDDHLSDLQRWVDHRLSLHRLVEGWGVAQGLEVGLDRHEPRSVVTVGPGYARACCGEDVVLCEPQRIDVCASAGPCCAPADTTAPPAVDLYLVPVATPVDPVLVPTSCGCGGHDGAEHERVLETGELLCVPVADTGVDRETLHARDWERRFRDCARVVADYNGELGPEASPEAAAGWLLSWIDRSTPDRQRALGTVRARLAGAGRGGIEPLVELVEIVSALRRHHVRTTVGECTEPGVRLARIWTGTTEKDGCVVECVDAEPPYRRDLEPPGWPAEPGTVNVAAVLWQRWDLARPRLAAMGLAAAPVAWETPRDGSELESRLAGEPVFVRPGTAVTATLYRDRCGHWDPDRRVDGRVVALAPVPDEAPRAPRRSRAAASAQGGSGQGGTGGSAGRPAARRGSR